MKGSDYLKSVLKYPGSKWSLANKIIDLIPKHHSYVEPYFGSGAIFFNKQPSDIELINDMDDDVVNLFNCIREDSERLARIVMCIPFSRKEYDMQFQTDKNFIDDFDKAARFLVKCWQGHGFRTNGYKVGWKNDVQGRERMYALWNWYRLPEWIVEIAERLRTVQVENRPAIEVIKRFDYENVFMYLDPPYVLGTRTAKQYKCEMTDADHEELINTILQSKAKIMLSGYENDIYNESLSGWKKVSFNAKAEYGLKRIETVWMNYDTAVKQMSLFS